MQQADHPRTLKICLESVQMYQNFSLPLTATLFHAVSKPFKIIP
jgi:hypothetical protein